MNDLTDDDLFLDAVDTMVLDALARIGNDPAARFAFFRRLLAVAKGDAQESGRQPVPGINPSRTP
jgi:hypothetical protein